MCVNQATNSWVKCPEGVAVGSTIESPQNEQTPKKQTTQKQTTKKQPTTKQTTKK